MSEAGKGPRIRMGSNAQKYRDGHDRIFGPRKESLKDPDKEVPHKKYKEAEDKE